MTASPEPSEPFEWSDAPWGRVLRCRPLLRAADHFFTEGSLGLRDAGEWRGVADLAGVAPERLLLLNQVHGNTVVTAHARRDEDWIRPTADGAVSNDPSSALVVRVADCAPILLADPRRVVVAAVHAGWRSTLQRIALAAVAALRTEFDTDPSDLVVAIGPSLGLCCGEMGEEVVQAFRDAGHPADDIDRWFRRAPGRRPHFDLWGSNRDQLERAGVPSASIHIAGLCTRTHNELFHSYRAKGAAAGRMAAVIRPRA
jgi:YfiH family protein